jgi:hypothetical protein
MADSTKLAVPPVVNRAVVIPPHWCQGEPWSERARVILETLRTPSEQYIGFTPTARCLYRILQGSTYGAITLSKSFLAAQAARLGTTQADIKRSMQALVDEDWASKRRRGQVYDIVERHEHAEILARREHVRRQRDRRNQAIRKLAQHAGVKAHADSYPGHGPCVQLSVEAAERLATACQAAKVLLGWAEAIVDGRRAQPVPTESVQDLRDALGNMFDTETPLV